MELIPVFVYKALIRMVMETTSIHLKKEIADKAPIFAASEGKSLSSII